MRRRSWVVVLVGICVVCAGPARAQTATENDAVGARGDHAAVTVRSIDVVARVDRRGALRGRARYSVEGAGPLRLWVYADRLAVAPSAMDQRSSRWVFPREVDTREMDVASSVDGVAAEPRWERAPVGDPRGRDVAGGDLIVAVPPGARVVEVRFSMALPERYGRLGRVGRRVTMTGPWYPLPVEGDTIRDTRHRVSVTVADGLEAFAPGGAESGRGVTTLRRVSDEFVPLVIAPRLHRYERALPDGHRLVVVSPRALAEPPPADATGVASIRDLTEVYVLEQLERVASDAARTLAMLREAGCATPIESSFVVALVPSRTELASTAPGLTLVSDRAFQIFPHVAARSFHDRAVRRALFRQALASCPATAALEPPDDRAWSTDLRAALLADLDEVRRQGRAQSARELLGWAGFHPAIDQLLYAPQTAFPDVYFAGIVEPDPFRDDPAYARRPRSKGRRILEMARDALGDERFASFSEALLQRVEPARQALARVAPEMASRLDEWLGAAGTEVNYVLVGVETSSRPEGGYRHRIRIRRDGDPRREPVEVRVRARGGDVSALWDGAGAEGVVEVETEGRLRDVLVDPRGRLAQSDEVARDHPRADDATRHPWRPPVVQSFNLAVGATERVLVGLLDVAMRRQYDTEDTIGLRLSTDPRSTGGLLRWVRGLGAPRDTNVRRGFIAPGIYFDRLHGGFARDDEPGGFRLGAQLAAGWSSLRWFLDPRHGGAAWASLASSLVFRDDGTRSWTLSPSIRANLTRPLGLRGAIVVAAGAAGVIGEPLPGERPGLGGRFLLRGYQNAEVLGRARAFAVVEGRFTPTAFGDLDLNLAHLAWVRELQLAAFVGAGVVFAATDGRDVVAGAEVGVGLRAHFEYGGVQPAVLVFDLAVPLIRGEDARNLPPITTLIAFEQYF